MSDGFRAQIHRALDRQLQIPSGIRREIVEGAARGYRSRSRHWLTGSLAVAMFAVLVGGLFFGLRASRLSGTAGPSLNSPAPAASPSLNSPAPTASPSATASASACPPPSVAATGCLLVTPSSGPVGSAVVIEGTGCSYPGRSAYLVFEDAVRHDGATVGGVDIPNVPVDANGHLRLTFTIPTTLHPIQQNGGGPTMPGTYAFVSRPVGFCWVEFTVTAH
jgi:hypothetical protein